MPVYANLAAYQNGEKREFARPTLEVPAALTTSATAAAGALAPALAAPTAGETNFITGFEVTGGGATAASVIAVTVTGTIGGTLNYRLAVTAGATLATGPLLVVFPNPIPASAVNTAITLNVPSFGAGNTDAAATIHGFKL